MDIRIEDHPQPIKELRRLIGGPRGPQGVLRIGHGWPVSATPRRPVGELLLALLAVTILSLGLLVFLVADAQGLCNGLFKFEI